VARWACSATTVEALVRRGNVEVRGIVDEQLYATFEW
jgi:hypothetical protein